MLNNRQSARLKEYNYSEPGAYFVTICTKNRECIFGQITDVGTDLCVRPNPFTCPEMRLNEIGKIIDKWLKELTHKFLSIQIDESIIMPNHFHAVINITEPDMGTHAGVPLHRVIQWFKTMTTNDYFKYKKKKQCRGGPMCPPKKLWQRNYYEHVIRNEADLQQIRQYIINNPINWATDRNNPLNFRTCHVSLGK